MTTFEWGVHKCKSGRKDHIGMKSVVLCGFLSFVVSLVDVKLFG